MSLYTGYMLIRAKILMVLLNRELRDHLINFTAKIDTSSCSLSLLILRVASIDSPSVPPFQPYFSSSGRRNYVSQIAGESLNFVFSTKSSINVL